MTTARTSPAEVESRTDLGRELTALRVASGLTVRELARRLDVPLATLGDYFSGRHLPGPAQVDRFRQLLAECDVTAGDEQQAWLDALARARRTSDGRSSRPASPYRGLEAFGEEDAGRFFGREQVTSELLDHLRAAREAGGGTGGMLVLVGPSGSGKSSLLRAGVLPAVRSRALDSGGSRVTASVISPGTDPLEALRQGLASVEPEPSLLVVDQLEEAFAATVDAETRTAFFEALAGVAGASRIVLLALRADFYEAAAREQVLLPVLQHGQILLGPMTEEEVRRAVVEPAHQVGAVVEDGLVELLLNELAPRRTSTFAHESGALPLLSYALLATWQRARRNELTIATYRETGGLRGAVRQSADDLYATLDPAQQALARRLFLRLVHVAADMPPIRRRVRRSELSQLGDGGAGPHVEDVLDRFVNARLVTADAESVQLSHEALLEAWPRLASWLEADRAGLHLHHQLRDAATAWSAAGYDDALLMRGNRLHAAVDWGADPAHALDLNRAERDFLEASVAQSAREQAAQRRRTRRMRGSLATTGALAVVTSLLAAFALTAQSDANTLRDEALSRQLAVEAEQLQPTEPNLAMQLALAAYHRFPTVQARSMLLDVSSGEMPTRLLGPNGPAFVSVDHRGSLLAVARSAANDVRLYSVGNDRRLVRRATIRGSGASDQLFAVALRADGSLLATGGTGRDVLVYDVADPGHPRRVADLTGLTGTVYALAFSPGGGRLVAVDGSGRLREWDLADPAHPVLRAAVEAPGSVPLKAVAFDPTGHLVAAGGANGTLLLWHEGAAQPVQVRAAGSANLESVAFSPNGQILAAGGDDGLVHVFSLGAGGSATPARAPLHGFQSIVYALAFSPDGRALAGGDAEGSLHVWDTKTWALQTSLAQPNPITSLAFEPSGRTLVSADRAGTMRLWPLPSPSSFRAPGNVHFFQYARSGHLLATTSGGSGGDVAFWDTATGTGPRQIAAFRPPASFGPVDGSAAWSPGRHLLAVADAKAQVQLVDVRRLAHPRLLGPPLTGDTPLVEQLAFSPSATLLAASDDAGKVHLWDVRDPSRPEALAVLSGPHDPLFSVAFSPDGRLLAAASGGGHVWLWDVADPAHPRRLAELGGFSSYAFSVAFSPDGRTLAAGSADRTVRMWDVSDPVHPRLLGPPLMGPTAYVNQVAFSPNGRMLAAATTDHVAWLWNVADRSRPRLLAQLDTPTGSLFAVDFSPDGKTLVASGSDQTLHFWDVHTEAVARAICAAAGSPVTRTEWQEYAPGVPYDPPCP